MLSDVWLQVDNPTSLENVEAKVSDLVAIILPGNADMCSSGSQKSLSTVLVSRYVEQLSSFIA